MAFKNKQIILRYVSNPVPTVFTYVLGKDNKSVELIEENKLELEEYQVEGSNITDTEVIGKKIVNSMKEIDKTVKDKIILLYDTPDILRFSTIVPKMNINKVKPIAKKELNDFFRSGTDSYKVLNRVVTLPEKGIVFYYDLISSSFISQLDKLAVAMDFYIDSHASFPLAIAESYSKKYPNENTFLIYKDELVTHVMLLLKSKLIDVLSSYSELTIDNIVNQMELLRNKHLFAFEKFETSKVSLIIQDDPKALFKEKLEKENGFEVSENEIKIEEIIKNTYENISKFSDGFYIKV